MHTRDGFFSKVKALGISACERVEPFLIHGAMATNLYILMASQNVLDTRTCEDARAQLGVDPSLPDTLSAVFVADLGIYIFITAGAIRAIAMPTTHWAYNKVADVFPRLPRLSDYRQKSLEIGENEFIKAVSTASFIAMLPLSVAAFAPMLPVSLLPFARIFFRHRLNNYLGSASLPTYRKAFPNQPRLAIALAGIESISTGINLGSALNGFGYTLVNTFFDANHPRDWRHTNQLLYGVTALGFVIGIISALNETTHSSANHVADTLQAFFLIYNVLMSVSICLAPTLGTNTSAFIDTAIGVGLFSLLAAEIRTLLVNAQEHAAAGPRVEDVTDEESEPEEYISNHYGTFFPRINVNDDQISGTDRDYDTVNSASSTPRGQV